MGENSYYSILHRLLVLAKSLVLNFYIQTSKKVFWDGDL